MLPAVRPMTPPRTVTPPRDRPVSGSMAALQISSPKPVAATATTATAATTASSPAPAAVSSPASTGTDRGFEINIDVAFSSVLLDTYSVYRCVGPRFCSQCGKPRSSDAKFCSECGAKF